MRYSRTVGGDMYFASTAVVVCETVKLVTSTALLMREETSNMGVFEVLRTKVFGDAVDFLKLGVSALRVRA